MSQSTRVAADPSSPATAGPLRVLQIGSGNLFGGIEVCQRTFAAHRVAAPDMHQEYAFCFSGETADQLRATGVDVHLLGSVRYSRPWTILAARRRLRRMLRDRRFDVVVCHELWVYGLFATAIRKERLPLWLWLHARHGTGGFLEGLARRTPPDRAIVNSQWSSEGFEQFLPNVQYSVLYCPIDLENTPLPDSRDQLRARFNTRSEDVVILQVGRWEPNKGHLAHFEALATLRDIPGWVCWQVGAPQRPAEFEYLALARARATELGIIDRVRFLGHQRQAELAAIREAAEIYCQPNIDPDSFGLTLVEALAAGLPVVTSALGGPLEIVTPECGILARPGSASDIASALRLLLNDPLERRRLGRAGIARARALCEPRQQVRRLAALLGSHDRTPGPK